MEDGGCTAIAREGDITSTVLGFRFYRPQTAFSPKMVSQSISPNLDVLYS